MNKIENVKELVDALFKNVEIAAFPDENYRKSCTDDKIFIKEFAKNDLVLDFFDVVEKHVGNDNAIQKIVLKCTDKTKVKIDFSEVIDKKFMSFIDRDEYSLGFYQNDNLIWWNNQPKPELQNSVEVRVRNEHFTVEITISFPESTIESY